MKKYFICFCLFCYFLYSNLMVVSASEIDNEILIEENIDIPDMPMVHDNYDTYSVGAGALGLGSLGSGALGGVLGGTGVVVGGLLAGGALALGGYVVGKGLYNIYNQVKNWYISQADADAIELDYEILNDGSIKFGATSVPDSLVQNLGSTMSYEVNNGLFSTLNPQSALTKKNNTAIYMPSGVTLSKWGGTSNTGEVSGNCGASYSCYAVTNGAYQFYYNGINYFLTDFKFQTNSDTYGNPAGSTLFYGAGYMYNESLKKYLPFTSWKSFYLKDKKYFSYATTINNIYYYDATNLFSNYGLSYVSSEDLTSLIAQTFNQSGALTIPKDYIGVANPGLTWNGQSWVDSSGETTKPNDMVMPFPDMFNPTTGEWGFSDTIADSVGGTTTTPDTSVPDAGTGWLSSVLNAIKSLPSLIASAFTGMIDNIINAVKSIPNLVYTAFTGALSGIKTAIDSIPDVLTGIMQSMSATMNKTWEWCQGLPNVLGDLLSALGSAIVDGLTLALEGVVSGIQSILDFIAGILDFVMSLFIPESLVFDDLIDKFNNKIPLVSQIQDLFSKLHFDYEPKKPDLKIIIPEKWGGGVYDIDLTTYDTYRPLILSITRLFIWFNFLFRQYKYIPSDISGGGGR